MYCTVHCTVVSTCNEVYPAQCRMLSAVKNCTKHLDVPLQTGPVLKLWANPTTVLQPTRPGWSQHNSASLHQQKSLAYWTCSSQSHHLPRRGRQSSAQALVPRRAEWRRNVPLPGGWRSPWTWGTASWGRPAPRARRAPGAPRALEPGSAICARKEGQLNPGHGVPAKRWCTRYAK